MKYMGSKNRIAKHILPIILSDRKPNQYVVDPFCGGGNFIDKVEGNRMASDAFYPVVQAMNLIKNDLEKIPKNNTEFTENDYYFIKTQPEHELFGYVGFALSYGAMFFSSFRRDKHGLRDYVAESYRASVKQSKIIQSLDVKHQDYLNVNIPLESIIYCDPPYKNTAKYKIDFNHEVFYNWCRKMKREGHSIFVSEYQMPDDFTCVWEKEIVSSLSIDTGSKKGVEKLFTL